MTAYDRFAPYYDALYEPSVDYEGDADFLEAVFAAHAGARPVKRVLDLGSGTGSHALRLARRGYAITGVDLSPELTALARAKVPAARFEVGDFTRAMPAGSYDAAVCMFGAWCYATSDEDSARVLALLRERLPAGGLFVFEFWSPYGWRPNQMWSETELGDGRRLLRFTHQLLPIRNDVYLFSFEHIVLRGEEMVDHFVETHALRMRTPAQTEALVRAHGFEVAAMTSGELQGKSLAPPRSDAMRVMCVARRRAEDP